MECMRTIVLNVQNSQSVKNTHILTVKIIIKIAVTAALNSPLGCERPAFMPGLEQKIY